ncbi:type II toxin-antitoxin system VapB family antitoxin [bacterium]|nr:type II toxin-antitoxin system VapB family antitoxin [candidate division CSSED10-310 bacterium]
MRTNIVIDDRLMKEAMRMLNIHTKKEVVDVALRRLIQHEKRREISRLKGKVDWDSEYDYKALRR